MKANELMIGDWVRCTDPKPFRITDIETECGTPYFSVTGTDCLAVDGGDLQPIPLTAEILEKNGFKVDPTINPFAVRLVVEMYSHGTTWKDEHDAMRGLRYVHELQHALRLCGIDKEVVI